MRYLKLICFFSAVFIATAINAIESPSLDLGKSLFEATELGTKQRSCATCHAEGKGLEMISDFSDQELKDIVNACIRDALDGKMLAIDSQEMDALTGYIRSFQKAD
ncbi:MAG: cytochrome C [Deltaproteobacteria bacterium]|jgi:cytochrome c|nr:cytochrome C [Deltaproteobacteria bacterium]